MMKRKYMEGKTNERTPALLVNDDGEEDAQINTFFSLVRNIRDAQSRMSIGSEDGKGKEKQIKSTWIPSFKREDFADQDHHHAIVHLRNNVVTTLPSSSKTQQEQPKAEEHEELDLNLSL